MNRIQDREYRKEILSTESNIDLSTAFHDTYTGTYRAQQYEVQQMWLHVNIIGYVYKI